ncbi:MAG: DNA-directed RNA polymerase subunit beta' [Candidatus Paceibacterota bacterium]|jgi:DNA-directed RNA polymerase subunit beta'
MKNNIKSTDHHETEIPDELIEDVGPIKRPGRVEKIVDFNAVSIRLASPDRILDWSYGEVTKPETINYRSGRSERGGLFDERIFGPEKDYECYCGKYKRIRYKDIICEKCGVEVTRSIVRRERMGHIELASPVAHIWFVRGVPSRIGLVLGLSVAEVEKVIYFAGYIITKVNEEEKARILRELDGEYKQKIKLIKDEVEREKLKLSFQETKRQVDSISPWKVIDEITYHRWSLKYGPVFEAGLGAEAIHSIFKGIDLGKLREELGAQFEKSSSLEKPKVLKRYNLVKSLERSGVRPEWMFLKVIPVIPPALRPMVALDGGRHATSDVNDLYRRVINRNNRLKKLIELNAPEVILRNEKRILQEAVDALLDNAMRQGGGDGAMNQAGRRPLKSLADNLKGKQGRFRQNLLGKRVDYSGRSVIVVGPELALDECGLPKQMALELFRPFVISQILKDELAYNIRGAGRLIDEGVPEVWAILEGVIENKYVLLNRAPTLHRLGIQAFKPLLIEGNAIRLHPLTCAAFNADFDGDQMAVHVPLSVIAQKEAREIIAANRNILKPGSGDPVINMRLDVVLGSYWVTKLVAGSKGEGKSFTSPHDAILAYDFGELDLRAQIKVMATNKERYREFAGQIFETSAGRLLFNNNLPSDYPFYNKEVTGKSMAKLVESIIARYGVEESALILDKIKNFGFKYSTKSGITWGMDDVSVPVEKVGIIAEAKQEVEKIENNYNDGFLSDNERYRLVIETWNNAKNKVEKVVPGSLAKEGSVSYMIDSNARGSISQVVQMAGMKGLIINTAGRLVDFPIIPCYKEGLSPLEYFITTHGSRKTLADTALNTAKAGYLTRKLVDVSQDIIITEEDCGDREGKLVTKSLIASLDSGIGNLIKGRVLAKDVVNKDGTILFKRGHLLSKADAAQIEAENISEASIRSPLACKLSKGLCQKCYGLDMGRNHLVEIGQPVGIVAAQAIGEPGTQLTMRTKHSGGIGTGGVDIVGGLPRVEEIFERRTPKNPALISPVDGTVTEVRNAGKEYIINVLVDPEHRKKSGDSSLEFSVPFIRTVLVKKGANIKKGDLLTDGPAELPILFKMAGKDATENYVIKEINAIYELQGVNIARKHIELIVRQMFSRRRIKDPGDTKFVTGEIVELFELVEENELAKTAGQQEAIAEITLLGISEVALSTSSFLSAVSFQHTTKVLIDTAIKGSLDKLKGLKENVIIGRLIPAGTGLIPDYGKELEEEMVTDEGIVISPQEN